MFLRASLTQAISLVPEKSLVGLITYGAHVQVHELGFSDCPKAYVFRGSKDLSKEQILEQLGLSASGAGVQRGGVQQGGAIPGQLQASVDSHCTGTVTSFSAMLVSYS